MKRLRGGALAVIDQGLAVGSHFVIQVLSARWMGPEHYGLFALLFTVYQVIFIAHNALLVEPMLVLGSTRYHDKWKAYVRLLLRSQMLFCVGLIAFGSVLYTIGVWWSAAAVTAAAPLAPAVGSMLLVAFVRRRSYAEGRPGAAVWASVVYLVVATGLIVLLRDSDSLPSSAPWLALGVAGIASSAAGSTVLDKTAPVPAIPIREAAIQHWRYGGWVLAAGLLGFFASGLNPWLVHTFGDLAEVGSYRAVLNLAMPGTQALSAIGAYFLPEFARAHQSADRTAKSLVVLLIGLSAAYLAAIVFFGQAVMNTLYGADTYAVSRTAVLAAGALTLVYAPMSVNGMILRARGHTRLFMKGSAFAGVVGAACSIPFVAQWGIEGALFGTAVAYVAGGAYLGIQAYRLWGRRIAPRRY